MLICGLGILSACDSDVDQQVRVILPADLPSIPSGVIRMSLWVYDPLLADAPATLADMDSVRFSHVNGQAQTFHLFVEADVPGRQKHYITAQGFELTPECERYVLYGPEEFGAPSVIVMQSVPQPGCFDRLD